MSDSRDPSVLQVQRAPDKSFDLEVPHEVEVVVRKQRRKYKPPCGVGCPKWSAFARACTLGKNCKA